MTEIHLSEDLAPACGADPDSEMTELAAHATCKACRSVLPQSAPVAVLRALAGLTQRQLAERLSVSHTAVYKAEQRGSGVAIRTLAGYADACGYRLTINVEQLDD
jgi:DNA-directed RNA polymerase specialized sigma24 family protein